MHRVDTPGHVANRFSAGDPPNGVQPTQLGSDWHNDLQENICQVIENAGIVLSKNDYTQLRTAIATMISNASLTAAQILARLITVDGSGSGLDADLLRGLHWASGQNVSFGVGNFNPQVIVGGDGTLHADGNLTGAIWAGPGNLRDYLDGRFAALSSFGSSIAASGYIFLPGGLLAQWTNVSCTAGGATSFSWPLTFNNLFAAVPGGKQGLGFSGSYSAYLSGVGNSGGTAYGNNGGGVGSTVSIIAIGN